MTKNKLLLILLIFNYLLYGCGGEVAKALRNEKNRSTDEFLVKKKGPLTQPPDFNSLPTPNSKDSSAEPKEDIRTMLKAGEKKVILKKQASSSEESILDKIR
jgi:hypothetical protein|tara:strand:+ start:514 stop:819 length:306 start_codon:yes stop_codon:yes gene_type:complete